MFQRLRQDPQKRIGKQNQDKQLFARTYVNKALATTNTTIQAGDDSTGILTLSSATLPSLRNIFGALVHRRRQLFRGTRTRLMGVTMLGVLHLQLVSGKFCKRPQRQSVMGRPTNLFERGKHAVPWSRSRFGLADTLCRQRQF